MSGIYIHIPFCKSKCSYCDFYSVARPALMDDFLEALKTEITLRKDELKNNKIETIYFGGGTPSLLKIDKLREIFELLYGTFDITNNCEITLEANPDDLNKDYLHKLKESSINRLSIGLQSFNNDTLKMMHRRHTAEVGISSVISSAEAGFDNISIDLIYGIEGMTENDWSEELERALTLPVSHLSAYHLGIEEGTLLHRKLTNGEVKKTDEYVSFNQYLILLETSSKYGFNQYEISNFAKDGRISAHNSAYWNRSEYLGFGPSAHSLIEKIRTVNSPDIKAYIENYKINKRICESDILTETDILNETIMLELRTVKGICLSDFMKTFGHEEYNLLLIKAAHLNPEHYKIADEHLTLTPTGMFVSDGIISSLFK